MSSGPDENVPVGAPSPEERARFFDAAEGYSEYLCSRVGEARLFVKTEDKHIGRSIFMKQGRGDIKTLARCVMTLRALLGAERVEGKTFIDVGANIGTTTVPALVYHPFRNAVAIEPEPENFTTLRLNLVLNGVDDRATTLLAAASNAVGELDLVVSPARSGRHWIASSKQLLTVVKEGEMVVKVPTVTLDSLAQVGAIDPDSVALVWIDAENHEGQILAGATQLVERGVPVIFEWDPAGLDRRGDARKIERVVGRQYTHFLDMRGTGDSSVPFRLHTADELEDYAHTSLPGGDVHFTEILALRLTRAQAKRAEKALRNEKARLAREAEQPRREATRPDEAARMLAGLAGPDSSQHVSDGDERAAAREKERARIERELTAMTLEAEKRAKE